MVDKLDKVSKYLARHELLIQRGLRHDLMDLLVDERPNSYQVADFKLNVTVVHNRRPD